MRGWRGLISMARLLVDQTVAASHGIIPRESVERRYWTEHRVREAVFAPDAQLIITADLEGTLRGIAAQEGK